VKTVTNCENASQVHNSIGVAASLVGSGAVGGGGGGGILKRLPVKSPELVGVFIEASRTLKSIFLSNKEAKKFKNHRCF
jgi:hypothetical protein